MCIWQENSKNSYIVFGLIRMEIEPTIYLIRSEHAFHYTVNLLNRYSESAVFENSHVLWHQYHVIIMYLETLFLALVLCSKYFHYIKPKTALSRKWKTFLLWFMIVSEKQASMSNWIKDLCMPCYLNYTTLSKIQQWVMFSKQITLQFGPCSYHISNFISGF